MFSTLNNAYQMVYIQHINVYKKRRESNFLMSFRKLSFDYKMAPVQCVTPMTNVGRTVNLWSFFCCAKKNFTWWFSIHTHSHTQAVRHAHIERKIPHLPTTTKPTGGLNHFFVLFFLLSKVNKRSLRDNIVRAISIWTWTWTRAWRQRNKEVAIVRKRRKRKIKWKKINKRMHQMSTLSLGCDKAMCMTTE